MIRILKQLYLVSCLLLPLPVIADAPITDKLTGLKFVSIPSGQFVMGTTDINQAVTEMPKPDKTLITDELPAHKVKFSEAFFLSSTEITQKMWLDINGDKPGPDSHWQRGDWRDLPVVSVSWHAVQAFIETLNNRSNQYRYRLPTEAEWEYAARAGDNTLRPFNLLAIDEYAWYLHSSNDEVQAVGKLKANPYGLYDMFGNVWEWVSDWYAPGTYSTSKSTDPTGPATGSKKVRRGGSYHCPPHLIRPGYRAADTPDTAYSVTGFRLVRESL